jgi:hypothetical protein
MDDRVADLLSRLSKEDKITKGDSLLSNDGKAIDHLSMPQYQWYAAASEVSAKKVWGLA